MGPEPRLPSAVELWRRHGVDVTVIYSAFFLVLALAGIPIGVRVGGAVAIAAVFGSFWISSGPTKPGSSLSSKRSRLIASTGYWVLAFADWLGYLGIICFATALVAEIV